MVTAPGENGVVWEGTFGGDANVLRLSLGGGKRVYIRVEVSHAIHFPGTPTLPLPYHIPPTLSRPNR